MYTFPILGTIVSRYQMHTCVAFFDNYEAVSELLLPQVCTVPWQQLPGLYTRTLRTSPSGSWIVKKMMQSILFKGALKSNNESV